MFEECHADMLCLHEKKAMLTLLQFMFDDNIEVESNFCEQTRKKRDIPKGLHDYQGCQCSCKAGKHAASNKHVNSF